MTDATGEREELFGGGVLIGMFLMGSATAFGIGFHQVIGTITVTGPLADMVPYPGPLNIVVGIGLFVATVFLSRVVRKEYISDSSTRVDA